MEVAKIYTTNNAQDQLVNQVNSYITEKGINIEGFAKEINYSRSAVSRFLNGKYDSEELKDRIAAHLNVSLKDQGVKAKSAEIKKPAFFENRDAANIVGLCSSCQEYSGLGALVGKSGFGKTFTLKHYAKLPKVAYVVCDDAMTSKDLLAAIERSIGLPTGSGTNSMRTTKICEFFDVNRNYLLIIDEADKLLGKYTQKKMEILRGIFDQTSVGMVVAGEEQLESMLKSYLPRFANRIEFYFKMSGLSADEVRKYLDNLPLDFEDDVTHEFIRRATNSKNGCFRLFDRTLNNILRVLSGNTSTSVTMKVLDKASEMMML